MTTPTKKEIVELDKSVEESLIALAKENDIAHDPIMDGVVDVDKYLDAPLRILWILKEPWEKLEDGVPGGDWRLTDFLQDPLVKPHKTHEIMAYVSYAILAGFPNEQSIPYVDQSRDVASILANVAVINVSKFPGETSSRANLISDAYSLFREVLLRQLSTLGPDVVIGGSTLSLFFPDLGLQATDFKQVGTCSSCVNGGRLYIDAYHPNQRSISRAAYVDDIVAQVKNAFPEGKRQIP